MSSFRDFILFLAGFEFFHTISHALMTHCVELPLYTKYVIFTPALNTWAIFVNASITILLLWWASMLKQREIFSITHH